MGREAVIPIEGGFGTPSISSRALSARPCVEISYQLADPVESLDPFMVEHEFRDRARDICIAHQR